MYKDYRKLLENKEVGAVVVAVSLNMHYPVAVDVINSERHLYLEKDMTNNISETLDLVILVKSEPKKTIQIGHQYSYLPLYYKVKEIINNDYLGKISQIDCRWNRNGNRRRPVLDKFIQRQINLRM